MTISSPKKAVIFLVALFASGTTRIEASDLAITHVTVINPGPGKPQPDMTVVVHDHTITAVVPSKQFKPSASMNVVEGRGKFVIPGLWDMHMHFRDAGRDLKMDVANGVLGVRNMGGAPKDVFPPSGRRSLRANNQGQKSSPAA